MVRFSHAVSGMQSLNLYGVKRVGLIKKTPNQLFFIIFLKKALTGMGEVYSMRSHSTG